MDKVVMPFLLFAVSIGLFFSYIRPTYDVVLALQEQESRLDNTISKTNEYQERVDILSAKLADIPEEQKSRLDQLLGKRSDPVRVAVLLDTLAERAGVTIENFDLPARMMPTPEQTQQVLSAQYAIECTGTYEDIKSMLVAMERSLTLLEVRMFKISRPNETEQDDRPADELDATIVFTTRILPSIL